MNWSWLIPAGKGIPVLMYHRVWPNVNDALTISPEKLRQQWDYLKNEGYSTLSLTDYLEIVSGKKALAGKAVLITFDDGYRNNLQYVYPLLKEFGWKATFFIIGSLLERRDDAKAEAEQKMTLSELLQLDPAIVQLAMHGYEHEDFSKIGAAAMHTVFNNAVKAFDNSKLPYHKVWAYAYGARPDDMTGMKKLMQDAGIIAAFRIGNKVSKVPADNMFEIKRIDIKGTDTQDEFSIKLRKGKLKPF